jgi:hypothetical protein
MPPFGKDEQVQAIHVLSVVEAAKLLVAELARAGGVDKVDASKPGVREALKALFDETSKLTIYQARAGARGTIGKLDDEKLSQVVREIRDNKQLSVDEEEARDMTQEDVDSTFSVEAGDGTETEPAPPPSEEAPRPKTDEEAFQL